MFNVVSHLIYIFSLVNASTTQDIYFYSEFTFHNGSPTNCLKLMKSLNFLINKIHVAVPLSLQMAVSLSMNNKYLSDFQDAISDVLGPA
jgi:hypothetical protein